MLRQIFPVCREYIDGKRPAFNQHPVGGMARIDAECNHGGGKRNLHDPGGRKGIIFSPAGDTNDIDTMCQLPKEKREIVFHGVGNIIKAEWIVLFFVIIGNILAKH